MNFLTCLGWFASVAMLLSYALEERSHWFTLSFAASCALASAYGLLQGAWPVGLTEAVWTLVAGSKWVARYRSQQTG